MKRLLPAVIAALSLALAPALAFATPPPLNPYKIIPGFNVAPVDGSGKVPIANLPTGASPNQVLPSSALTDETLAGALLTPTNGVVQQKLADLLGPGINLKAMGAKGDAQSWADGVMAAGSNQLSSASATFTANDAANGGKQICVHGVGALGVTLCGTIASYIDAHDVTLSFSAVLGVPYAQVAWSTIVNPGTGYVPGEVTTPAGGTALVTARITVLDTQVVSATVVSGGTGGVNGTCFVTGTTGDTKLGHKFVAKGTVTAGVLAGSLTLQNSTHYFTNPANLAAEPVTGCGLTGATVSLVMGAQDLGASTLGNYSIVPANHIAQGTTTGAGAGMTFDTTWTTMGQFEYGTDDSNAITLAVQKSESIHTAGGRACIVVPPGNYWLLTAPPNFTRGGCIQGPRSKYEASFTLDTRFTGDAFSWSDAGFFNALHPIEPVTASSTNAWGASVSGISIYGSKDSPNIQNGLMFYDRTDKVFLADDGFYNLSGQCITVGHMKRRNAAYMREGKWLNIECRSSGTLTLPAIDIYSDTSATPAGGAASDILNFINLEVYFPRGVGVRIADNNPAGNTRSANFFGLTIHGEQNPLSNSFKDLLQIGDPSLLGNVSAISIYGYHNAASYVGAAVAGIYGSTGNIPADILIDTYVQSGSNVFYVQAGTDLQLRITNNNTSNDGTLLTVGPTPLVGPNIELYDNGEGGTANYNIDPSAVAMMRTIVTKHGPQQGVGGLQLNESDGTPAGGNARDATATDMQTSRTLATQVAKAANATIAGGRNNTADGIDSWVPGGNGALIGGRQAVGCWAGGSGFGSACEIIMSATTSGSASVRLTTGGGAANATNCLNLAANMTVNGRIMLTVNDRTTTTDAYSWSEPMFMLTRPAAGSVQPIVVSGNAAQLAVGSAAWLALTPSSVVESEDSTNQCLNLAWTPPVGNTDLLNITARVLDVEAH